jgi:23S rRNA (adenine2030-N6)-methyltransferase
MNCAITGIATRKATTEACANFVNYRHAFHAGSFADVFKHAVLCRILIYLRQKPAAFRVFDSHAGAGVYDLTAQDAARGGEWRYGIERLMAAKLSAPVDGLLARYLEVVGALNGHGRLTVYPGSPMLTRAWLRPQDRMLVCELAPQVAAALERTLRGDTRIKTLQMDGWTALAANVPPPERRGLVLIDPPFEQDTDFRRLAEGLAKAHRKWATGIYMLWYPIKDRGGPDALAKRLRRLGLAKTLRAELLVAALSDPSRLNGCGLILVNPPWTLPGELAILLPALAKILGRGPRAAGKVDWLVGESASRG